MIPLVLAALFGRENTRREVAEITAAEAVAEIITVGIIVVVAEALPAGTMMVAAHPTTNVAMNIIHRRLAAAVVVVAAAVALAVTDWTIAAAAGDAVAVIDPGNRWGRLGRLDRGPPGAVGHRPWVIVRRWVRAIRSRCRPFAGERHEVGLLVVSGTMDAAG